LLKRFKPVPSSVSASNHDLALQEQHPPPFSIRSDKVLELIWSLASLCAASEVPFAQQQARLLDDLLCYITHENEKSVIHALVCTVHIVLKRLHAPSDAPHQAAADVQRDACVQDKSRLARALLDVLSQVAAAAAAAAASAAAVLLIALHALTHRQPPCDLGSKGKPQPHDFSIGGPGRALPRRLIGPLATLQVLFTAKLAV
jgi:hypothetical protein